MVPTVSFQALLKTVQTTIFAIVGKMRALLKYTPRRSWRGVKLSPI